MKSFSKLFFVIAMLVIHGSLLAQKSNFGPESQNPISSISIPETWSYSSKNGSVVKSNLKVQSAVPRKFSCSIRSANDVAVLQQTSRGINTMVGYLLKDRPKFCAPTSYEINSHSIDSLVALQQACRIIDTICQQLNRNVTTQMMLVIDVDPGTDDAVALYLCKLLQLAPTHFVATMGNRPLTDTFRNLLILKKMFGLNGVVVKGSETTVNGKVLSGSDFHGTDGLAGLQNPLSKVYVTQKDSVGCRTLDDLANDILLSDFCIYIATGPVSSLAYILEKYKDCGIENHISKLIVMGGGINRFNIGGDREYNFAGDGEAVKIVFNSSLDITLFPLDITELYATIDSCQLAKIKSSPGVHPIIKPLIQQNYESNMRITRDAIGAVLHDCLPILYLMYPEEFDVVDMRLQADSRGKIIENENDGRVVHVAKSCTPNLLYNTILSIKTKEVIILFETDVHGELENYARLAYLADSLSAEGKIVLIVSGGDFSSGNCVTGITKGEAAIRIINNITHYCVFVPGNHEWDYGFETLKRNDSLLSPEMICCNVFYRDSLLFKPYKIKNVEGKRIAFIGVLTSETTSTACPADFKVSKEYRILDGDELAIQVQKCIDEVRNDSLVDFVFLLAHLGDEDNLPAKKGISKKTTNLLSHISGVDAVLNGHDHKEKNKMLCDKYNKKIPELSTGQSLAKIGIIRIFSDGTLSTELLPIDKVKGMSSTVKATIDSIQNCYAYIKKPIGTVDFPLFADNIRVRETNLGDYVADAILWVAKQTDYRVSMAIVNSGSIRKNIFNGTVNYEQKYNAVPFANYICIVKLKGDMIESVLNQMVETWPDESGGFPQVTGITFSIDTLDKNRVKDIMVRLPDDTWTPLDSNMEYYVATTDFIASGGDSVDMNIDINTDVIPLYTKLYMIDVVSMYYKMFGVMSNYEKPGNRINTNSKK